MSENLSEAIRMARYLGADAAAAHASGQVMSESDANSILTDVDPAVLDNYREPNLSGEWADDPTPQSLANEVGWSDDDNPARAEYLAGIDALAEAWEEGRDRVWNDALQGVALRTLGRIAEAMTVERRVDHNVSVLRAVAGSTLSLRLSLSRHRAGRSNGPRTDAWRDEDMSAPRQDSERSAIRESEESER